MNASFDNLVKSVLAFSIIEISVFLLFVFILIFKMVRLNTTKFVKSIMYLMLSISILEILIGGASLSIYFIYQNNNGIIQGKAFGSIFLLQKFINNLSLIFQSILIGNLCHKWVSTAHKIEGKYYQQTFGQLKRTRNIFFAALTTLCVFQFTVGLLIYLAQKGTQSTSSLSSDCGSLQSCINITQKNRHLLNVSSSFNVLNNILLISLVSYKFICGKRLQKSLDALKQLSNVEFKTWKFKGIYIGAFAIILSRSIIQLARQGYQFYVVNNFPCICDSTICGFTLYYIIYQIIYALALGLVFGAVNPIPKQLEKKQLLAGYQGDHKASLLTNSKTESLKESQLVQIRAQISSRPRLTQI